MPAAVSRRYQDVSDETRQPIAHLQFRHQVARPCRLVFQLLPQVRHVDAHVVGPRGIAGPPYVVQELPMSQHLALPVHHRDPLDRMLIAQALAEDVPVMTCDREFRKYKGVNVIW